MLPHGISTLVILLSLPIVSAISWNVTKYMFVFGDSYTADGYNVSAGVNSPTPGLTSSNGPNWVEFLTSAYNQTTVQTFDLASGGATIDRALVPPFRPTVLSVVDQVAQFNTYLAPHPPGEWNGANSLFAIWIGINDIGNSVGWTNITQREFYGTLMDRLFSQVDSLYYVGARNFLFLTVPPTNRAPRFIEQGPQAVAQMAAAIADYNTQLTQHVRDFKARHASDLGDVTVFDTQPVFNTLLDESQTFGFINVTGYCVAYVNGTPSHTYQVDGCAPVSSYFWLNSLHPLFTVHDILAKTISTALAGYPATQIPT